MEAIRINTQNGEIVIQEVNDKTIICLIRNKDLKAANIEFTEGTIDGKK